MKEKDVEKLEELMGLDLLDYQKKYLKEILKADKNEPLVFIPRRKVCLVFLKYLRKLYYDDSKSIEK